MQLSSASNEKSPHKSDYKSYSYLTSVILQLDILLEGALDVER